MALYVFLGEKSRRKCSYLSSKFNYFRITAQIVPTGSDKNIGIDTSGNETHIRRLETFAEYLICRGQSPRHESNAEQMKYAAKVSKFWSVSRHIPGPYLTETLVRVRTNPRSVPPHIPRPGRQRWIRGT